MLAALLSVGWLRLRLLGFDRLLDDTLLDRAFGFDVCAFDNRLEDTLLDRVFGFGVCLLLLNNLDTRGLPGRPVARDERPELER